MSANIVNKVAGIADSGLGSEVIVASVGTYNYIPSLHYVKAGAHALASVAIVANTSYLYPFIIPKGYRALTVKMTLSVTQADKSITCFIYSSGSDNRPDKLIATAASATTAGSAISCVLADDYVSDGSFIWVGYWSDASTATVNAIDISASPILPVIGVESNGLPLTGLSHFLGDTYSAGVAPSLDGGILSDLTTDAAIVLVSVEKA